MRCSSLWSQRLAVTAASTADAPPQVSCGRDGTGRAGRTTKAMCGRAGSLKPAQGQGDQGRAANCCALREVGQGLGTIELRGKIRQRAPDDFSLLGNFTPINNNDIFSVKKNRGLFSECLIPPNNTPAMLTMYIRFC